jgi:hypothetical protein
MYIYIYVCMYVSYTHTHTHTHTHTCIHIWRQLCSIPGCIYIYDIYSYIIYIYIYMYILNLYIYIGNSAAFLELVHELTGKPLTGDPWVQKLSVSVEELKVSC